MSKRQKPPSQRFHRNPPDRRIAMHEAGHAVVATLLGFSLQFCDIKRREIPGVCLWGSTTPDRSATRT
jgi:hypothetical protein